MPRDIFSPDTRDQPLVASPESGSIPASEDDHEDEYQQFTIRRDDDRHAHAQQLREGRAKTNERNELHPYVQTLSFQNLESCVQLENAVFPEQERCSEDKVGLIFLSFLRAIQLFITTINLPNCALLLLPRITH